MTPPLPQFESRVGLIGRIVAVCARNPMLTLVAAAALAIWGWYSLRTTPLDAIPDLSDTQVIVLTEWPGQSPDLIENQITYPVSSALLSTPRARVVRGQSSLGLSFVYVIFEDGTDLYWARSRGSGALPGTGHERRGGVRPTLGRDARSVGWVLQSALQPTKPAYTARLP